VPEKGGSAGAQVVEGPGAEKSFTLFVSWMYALEKIRQGGEGSALVFVEDTVGGVVTKALDPGDGGPDCTVTDLKAGTGIGNARGEQLDSKSEAFEDVDHGGIESLSVGEDRGHELGGIVSL